MRPDYNCKLCGLCKSRTNIVLSEGSCSSKIVFVGEAPGKDEDLYGRPFIGKSGKILDKIMLDVGINREDILMTNTVKCRPPNNRKPSIKEMEACKPFLYSELYSANLIVGLGKSACIDILGLKGNISQIINIPKIVSIYDHKIHFIPTFHPAATIYSKISYKYLEETMNIVLQNIKRNF